MSPLSSFANSRTDWSSFDADNPPVKTEEVKVEKIDQGSNEIQTPNSPRPSTSLIKFFLHSCTTKNCDLTLYALERKLVNSTCQQCKAKGGNGEIALLDPKKGEIKYFGRPVPYQCRKCRELIITSGPDIKYICQNGCNGGKQPMPIPKESFSLNTRTFEDSDDD